MKKVLMALVALFVGLQVADAQRTTIPGGNAFNGGTSVWNIGVGVGDNYLPISISYDYGIVGNLFDSNSALGLGAYGAFLTGKNISAYVIGPRASLHYNFVPKLDTYLALILGYRGYTDNQSNHDGGFAWGTHVGARYFFSPKVGMFAEAGAGTAFLNLGVTFKI